MEHEIYNLEPGFVYAGTEGTTIRTVLGSCVAVCLWDNRTRIGGMNHFLFPAPGASEAHTCRYGTIAIAALVGIMEDLGATRAGLTAQVFGGAQLYDRGNSNPVGPRNIDTARRVLNAKRLPIVSEDVGGYLGRKILFDISTGHVAVLKVDRLRQEDWIENG